GGEGNQNRYYDYNHRFATQQPAAFRPACRELAVLKLGQLCPPSTWFVLVDSRFEYQFAGCTQIDEHIRVRFRRVQVGHPRQILFTFHARCYRELWALYVSSDDALSTFRTAEPGEELL